MSTALLSPKVRVRVKSLFGREDKGRVRVKSRATEDQG